MVVFAGEGQGEELGGPAVEFGQGLADGGGAGGCGEDGAGVAEEGLDAGDEVG